MAASMLVACGGGSNNATSQAEGDKANDTKAEATAQVKPEKASYDMECHGKVLVDYMKPTFTVDESAILPTLKNDDVKIVFVSGLSPENFQEYKDAYKGDDFTKCEGYTYKEQKIGDFDAVMVTYVDKSWGTTYTAEYYIDFGKKANSYYGMKAVVTSEKSMDKCTSDEIMGILNSMQTVNK